MTRHRWGGKPKNPASTSLTPAERIKSSRGLLVLVKEYLRWLDVRGYSKQTAYSQSRHLVFFVDWAHSKGLESWNLITRQHLQDFQLWMHTARRRVGDKTATTTLRTQTYKLMTIKGMFRFLVKRGHLDSNPAADLEMPRLPKKLPGQVLTLDEVEALMNIPNLGHPLGVRLRAMLEVFYSTGIRRAELAALQLGDVDEGNGTVFVRHGKGAKDRLVPIGERALFYLRRYLDDVRPHLVDSVDEHTIFVNNRGQGFSRERIHDLVKNALNAAGIDKAGGPHLLRHTMATLMLEGGADIRYVQAMLGHAQLSTTEIYTHVNIAKLKEVHRKTHPARLPEAIVDHDDVESPTVH